MEMNLNRKKTVLIFVGLMASLLIYALDSTVFSTAMKKIVGEFGQGSCYAWPFTIYMLCSTVIIPISGATADLYGHKPVFLAGIAGFLTGSVLCGLSQSMPQLIVFRGIQGIGGGMIVSGVFTAVADICRPEKRGGYTGIVTSMYGIASIVGPVLGGLVTDRLGWRWIFFFNLPVGIAAGLILLFALPGFKPESRQKADFAGMSALILFLTPILLVFSLIGNGLNWTSPQTAALFILSVLMLFVFLRLESRAVSPTLPPEFFKRREISVCFMTSFLNQALMFAAVVYLPYFCQSVMGMSATASGAVIAPMMIGLLAASNIAGLLISKGKKCRPLSLFSFIVTAAGMGLLATLSRGTSYPLLTTYSVIVGFGVGINMPISNVNAQNSVARNQIGSVTAAVMFFKNAGRAVGTAVYGTVVAAAGTAAGGISVSSIHMIFRLGVVIAAAGAVCSLFLKEAPARTDDRSAHQPA